MGEGAKEWRMVFRGKGKKRKGIKKKFKIWRGKTRERGSPDQGTKYPSSAKNRAADVQSCAVETRQREGSLLTGQTLVNCPLPRTDRDDRCGELAMELVTATAIIRYVIYSVLRESYIVILSSSEELKSSSAATSTTEGHNKEETLDSKAEQGERRQRGRGHERQRVEVNMGKINDNALARPKTAWPVFRPCARPASNVSGGLARPGQVLLVASLGPVSRHTTRQTTPMRTTRNAVKLRQMFDASRDRG